MKTFLGACVGLLLGLLLPQNARADEEGQLKPTIQVGKCADFQVTGKGDAQAWQQVPWHSLSKRPNGEHDYSARFKMLYSERGIYVLFDGTDQTLTAKMQADFLDLWTEDVYECFFWTDEQYPVYFEYEISPLGYELPILIPNFGGDFLGWRPWKYERERKTQKAVHVSGGPATSLAKVSAWRAEVFFPYALFAPLSNVPPQRGDRWRANFYRVDYDDQKSTQWDWARVGRSFHEYESFGTVVFD